MFLEIVAVDIDYFPSKLSALVTQINDNWCNMQTPLVISTRQNKRSVVVKWLFIYKIFQSINFDISRPPNLVVKKKLPTKLN